MKELLMTMLRWIVLLLAFIPPVTASALAQTPAADVDIPSSLYVEGSPSFPSGKSGIVDVVAIGDPQSRSVAVVMRNNTDEAIELDDLVGVARDAQGKLAVIGEKSTTVPFIVEPGQLAVGDVYFEDELPPGVTFEFDFESRPAESRENGWLARQDIEVQEAVLTQNKVIGIVRNPTSTNLSGPITVFVICFDASSEITTFSWEPPAKDDLGPGETSPFSVTLYSPGACDSFIVGATGWQ